MFSRSKWSQITFFKSVWTIFLNLSLINLLWPSWAWEISSIYFLFVNTASDSFRNSLLNSTDEKITSSAEKVDKRTFESLYNLNQLKSSWHLEGCLTWMGSNQIPFIREKPPTMNLSPSGIDRLKIGFDVVQSLTSWSCHEKKISAEMSHPTNLRD